MPFYGVPLALFLYMYVCYIVHCIMKKSCLPIINELFALRVLALAILCFVFGAPTELCSQAIAYECDFEDSRENVLWELNVGRLGPSCPNRWFIGLPGKNNGEAGLFISSDNGLTNDYTKKGVSVVASRSLTIPAGTYELSFDWQAYGMDSLDGLYVCWMPDSVKTNSVNNSNIQKWVAQYGLDFGVGMRLYQKSWNAVSDTIVSDGSPYKLVFVWNNGIVGIYPPAAAVDNILILAVGFCNKPDNLTVTPHSSFVKVSWRGSADSYDVKCYSPGDDKWVFYNGIKDNFVDITGLGEGVCDYYVRSVCGGMYSGWVSISKFLYYPDNRCVDYLSLTANNCFYGTTVNPKTSRGVVDFGFQSKESRHTLHWTQNEFDPRTGNKLKTVPDGEIASVRLGNWNSGSEAESVEFKYKVDASSSAILILKYAVVLEDPGHDATDQPRLTLQVLKGNKPLDKLGCAEADFIAGYSTDGWNTYEGILWKDWTTVGINLKDYDGETLTIRLSTYDCSLGAHYGYAYFTLGCSDGKILGLSCGDDPQNSFQGPDGFRYRWYLSSDPETTLSNKQVFTVSSSDTMTYSLDVIHPTKDGCYYTLHASALPRYPVAVPTFSDTVVNCKNMVMFNSLSYVRRINHVSGDTVETCEPCESVKWDFGDGSVSTDFAPTHIFPEQGGKFKVTLFAGIAGDKCVDDTSFIVTLPRIGTSYDTIYANDCEGNVYTFNGKNYFVDGVYTDTLVDRYLCDSIVTLNLTMNSSYNIDVNDTICSNEVYYLGDKSITETGRYKGELKTQYGCDSIVNLHLIVNEVLDISIDSVAYVCLGDSLIHIPYSLHSGMLSAFDISFADTAAVALNSQGLTVSSPAVMSVPMSQTVKPGPYDAVIHFGEQSCGHSDVPLKVNVYYPHSVITQRWTDVLAVKNSEHNGGYEFVSFQWFKNGTPIDGATSANYYDEQGLDTSAVYSVLLTRKTDGVSSMVCPVSPMSLPANEDLVVTFDFQNDNVRSVFVSRRSQVNVWSSVGLLLYSFWANEGCTPLALELHSGIYLFEFISTDGIRKVQKILIQ